MNTLIQKDNELQKMLDTIPETLKGTGVRRLINEAIEKAYKSGLTRFNAFDNTMIEYGTRIKWHSAYCNFDTGATATLIRTYLTENGYVN
jgi:hypothetical protein